MELKTVYFGSDEGVQASTFADFYNRHWLQFLYFTRRYVQSEEDCKDLVGEAFLKVWHARGDFETEKSIIGFLCVAIRNSSHDLLRRRNTETTKSKEISAVQTDWSSPVVTIEMELAQFLREEVKNLPPQCRRVFSLALEGYDAPEIAAKLGVTLQTVYNQKRLAIRKLQLVARKNNLTTVLSLLVIMDAASVVSAQSLS